MPVTNALTACKDLSQVSKEGDAKSPRSTRRQVRNIDHRTGRLCVADDCSGELKNSVVLFGESLPAKVNFDLISMRVTFFVCLGLTVAYGFYFIC